MSAVMMEIPENGPGGVVATGENLDQMKDQLANIENKPNQGMLATQLRTNATVTLGANKDDQVVADQGSADNIQPMPEGGYEKYYNPKTGEYNWAAHAKEAEFRLQMAKQKQEKTKAVVSDDTQKIDLDWEMLGQKISTIGDIDPEDYEQLENLGIPREVVDLHVQGYRAMVELTRHQLYAKTGGPEQTQALLDWARRNLTEDEQRAYDAMLASPQWPVAIDALMARSGMSGNANRKLIRPGGEVNTTNVGYSSEEEYLKDLSDPRYKTSEAFRRSVYERLAKTKR